MYIKAFEINSGNEVKVGANFYSILQVKNDAAQTTIVFNNQKGEMQAKRFSSNDIVQVR